MATSRASPHNLARMGNDFACAHAPLIARRAYAEVLAVAEDQLHMAGWRGSVDATMAGVDLHSDTAT